MGVHGQVFIISVTLRKVLYDNSVLNLNGSVLNLTVVF